jgi:hypothetical protein
MMTDRLKKPCLFHKILIMAGIMAYSILSLSGANRYSVSSGDWSNPLIWSATSGGPPGAGVPGKNDNVYIENGHTVTVTSDYDCSSVTFTGQSAILIVNSPATLTLKNGVTLYKQTNSDSECFLTGTGTFICDELVVGTADNPPPVDAATSLFYHTFNSSIANLDISVKGSPKNTITINSYIGSSTHVRNGIFYIEDGILTVDGQIITNNMNAVNTSVFSMAAGSESGTMYLNSKPSPFNLSGSGTNIINLNGSASLVNYSYAGNQTVLPTQYNNITLSESGAKTVSGIIVNGILSMEGTATANGSTPTYNTNSALQYKGSASQTTGIEFPATFTGAGGVIIDNNNNVTLNSDQTIGSKLTFLNGKIVTTTYTLTMNSSAVILGAGAGKYVYGTLQKVVATGTLSKVFEIGDANTYAPVSLTFTGTISTGGSISAKTISGDHPNIGSSTFNAGVTVNRYWTLTNSGVAGFISCTAIFSFVATDIDPGADYSNFYVGNYNAATWTYPSVGSLTPTSTQANGLTTFGDFQIGELPVSSYRSHQSGNWDNPSTWESFDGTVWIPASDTPTSAAGYIIIRNSHIVTIAAPVTIDQLIIDPGGRLNTSSSVTVNNGPALDISVDGILDCAEGVIAGAGSFILNSSGELIITSADGITTASASGNIQTSSRTYSEYGNYTYRGTSSQVTGDGLPSIVNDLNIDNTNGVTLTNSVSVNGTLVLTSGPLTVGSSSIIFLTSDTPISRISGTITTGPSSIISFGTPADTTGAAFTIPAGLFTGMPEINELNIYRDNGITLNEQMLSVNGRVFCNGGLESNGNLTLLSSVAGTALIDGSARGEITGKVTMQSYLSSAFGYKYISSPFQSAIVNELSDDIDLGADFPTLFRYDEGSTTSGWVDHVAPDNLMNPMEGYAAHFGSSGIPMISDISGVVNNGPLSITLYNHNNTYTLGFNLVGNPYPSPVDWDVPAGWTKTNIDNALYFFRAGATDEYEGTYSTYINGISSDGVTSNIIPSMQGFFVHVSDGAYPVSGTLGLNNSARITDLTHQLIKSTGKSSRPLLRIVASFNNYPDTEDPLVFYFNDKASAGFNGNLDALKLLNTDISVPNLYALTDNGEKLSIDAIPEYFDPFCRIPLGIKTSTDGYIVFRTDEVGVELSGKYISISDLDADTIHNLEKTPYTVYLKKGEYNSRFFLNMTSFATDSPDTEAESEPLSVFTSHGSVKIYIDDKISGETEFKVLNMAGQIILLKRFSEHGYHEFNPGLRNGVYIAILISGKHKISRKIVIMNQ